MVNNINLVYIGLLTTLMLVKKENFKFIGSKEDSIYHVFSQLLRDQRCSSLTGLSITRYGDGIANKKNVELIEGIL
jgi:hypothetical protein